MEQIIIQISDKKKAKVLIELLAALDFVDAIKTNESDNGDIDSSAIDESTDFFSLAGIWQDREITLESIRSKAWPRQRS